MIKKEIVIAGKRCFVFADEEPEVLLLEPMDLRDLDFLDKEIETLKAGTARPFALATLIIEDWNKELAPWASEPVFGKDPFGDGASLKRYLAGIRLPLFSHFGARMRVLPLPGSLRHLPRSGIPAGWISSARTRPMSGQST